MHALDNCSPTDLNMSGEAGLRASKTDVGERSSKVVWSAATGLQVLSGRGHFCAPSRRLRPYFGCSFQPEASLSGVQRQKVCGAGAVNTLLPFEQLDVGTN